MTTVIKIFRPKEWNPRSIGNVTFLFSLGRPETRSTINVLVIYFIFRIELGARVEAGVGVDQKPGVGVRTAPARLRTPGLYLQGRRSAQMSVGGTRLEISSDVCLWVMIISDEWEK